MGVSGAIFPRWLVFLLLLPPLLFAFFRSAPEVVTVDIHAAKGLIHTGYVYLDVRTVEEFEKGHVDAAKIINIPYLLDTPKGRVKNPEFLKEVSSACNKQDNLIVGCQSGVRSLYAAADLQADGFKDVNNMGGGYLDWVQNKFPVKAPVAKGELCSVTD